MTSAQKKPVQTEGGGMPEWLVKHGIESGGYQYVTKAQLRTQERPDRPLKVRVWACGMLHTPAYQGEIAYTMHSGKRVLLTPSDIIDELQQESVRFYREAVDEFKRLPHLPKKSDRTRFAKAQQAILDDPASSAAAKSFATNYLSTRETKEHIRQVLEELEDDGVSDRTVDGKPLSELPKDERQAAKQIVYRFYLKPRPASRKKVEEEWTRNKPPEPPESGADSDDESVAKILLLKTSIYRVLKTFQIAKSRKSIETAEAAEGILRALEQAEKVFLEVAAPWLPVAPGKLPEISDKVADGALPKSPNSSAGSGGVCNKPIERNEEGADLSSFSVFPPGNGKGFDNHPSGGRAVTADIEPVPITEQPPARPQGFTSPNTTPTPGQEIAPDLRNYLLLQPVKTPLDEEIFQRIASRIPDNRALDEFKAVAGQVKHPRKWAIYETIARQVQDRSQTCQSKTAAANLSDVEREYLERRERRRPKPCPIS